VTRVRFSAAAAALCAVAAAGCGLGPGADKGDVELTVTRDYGDHLLVRKTDSISESDTVLRVLDRNADITTRYGGGFVQSIDGLAGSESGGRRSDWFFYVNGIESPVGSTDYRPESGDRIWWDYRDWTSAMRVPAVVGSFPEPFVNGFQGKRYQVAVDCQGVSSACDEVSRRLRTAGISSTEADAPSPVKLNVAVGTWSQLQGDETVHLLAESPYSSGVFATLSGGRRALLTLLDQRGQTAGSIGRGGGLVAALRPGDGPPTWVVTGTDRKGVAAAALLLGDGLRNHYAVATQPGAGPISVPVP
jgi:uncharacterized protein DUF4430